MEDLMLDGARTNVKRVLRAPVVLQKTYARSRGRWMGSGSGFRPKRPRNMEVDHYFDIYDRHFSAFREREVSILEVGIYSGGSLEM